MSADRQSSLEVAAPFAGTLVDEELIEVTMECTDTLKHVELGDELSDIEVSVVMPCLNEADTLRVCIEKARHALRENNIPGEIIVADNGSSDHSAFIALSMGARLVPVTAKGYGHALMGGIASARGKFIIMGDADDSYDFLEITKFVEKLRSGAELVQGCRLPSGGGRVMPGAMPLSHRWVGNPVFSFLVRRMFSSKMHDVYCGLRGFTREFYDRLDQRCTGMEFATEMIIKAALHDARTDEVPITLWPDGRKSHPPHLRTLRDGWRTLRFYLTYSPRWLFLYPGFISVLLGLAGYGIAMPGLTISGVTFDAHTLLFASLAILLGYQSILFAMLTKLFAIGEGLLPEDPRVTRFFNAFDLEQGLMLGAAGLFVGSMLLLGAVNQWRLAGFGHLDYAHTMRWVIPGVTLTVLGFQTVLNSFFASILRMRRR
jgi:glycosyltransferase involved in cell wall biosynthesis